jgi:hypothetical protein
MSDASNKKITAFRFIKPLVSVVLKDSSAHHLLMFLCVAANSDDGLSYHSQYGMQQRTGIDREAIRRATRMLEELGLITVESKGKNTNLRYKVIYEKLMEFAATGKALCADRRKSRHQLGGIPPMLGGNAAIRLGGIAAIN